MSKYPLSVSVNGPDFEEYVSGSRSTFGPTYHRYAISGRTASILSQYIGPKPADMTAHPLVVIRDVFVCDTVRLFTVDQWWIGKKIFWTAPLIAHLPVNLPGFLTSPDPGADGIARNKLLNAILDQDVNLANAIGERTQTIDLFVKTARRLAHAVMALRKGRWVQAARHLGYTPSPKEAKKLGVFSKGNQHGGKPLANAWLELQYGWKPLLQDVYGAATAIAKLSAEGNLFETARVTVKQKSQSSGEFSFVSRGGGSIKVPGSYTEQRDQVRKYYVRYSVSNGMNSSLAALGLTNPAALAWELTPLSFVVDWFVPIGSWLSTFGATAGKTFVRGWTSNQDRTIYKVSAAGGQLSYVRITYNRGVLSGFPSGVLPSFKNPLSGVHIANACALLSSAFGRR